MDDTLDLLIRALGTPGDRQLLLQAEDDISCFLREAPVDSSQPPERSAGHVTTHDKWWWCCSCAHMCKGRYASAAGESPSISGRPGASDSAPESSSAGTKDSRSEHEGFSRRPGSHFPHLRQSTHGSALRTLEFPRLPSYHRLLIHATARRFGLHSSSFPIWAEDCRALKSVHCSVTGVEMTGVPRPLLLFSDLIPMSSRPLDCSHLVEKLKAEGYCSLGSMRLGLEPLPRKQSVNPVCDAGEEVQSREKTQAVEDRSAEGGAEQRWLHDNFAAQKVTAEKDNTDMHRGPRPVPNEGVPMAPGHPGSGGEGASVSELEEAKLAQGTGTLKRKGRGRFSYRREKEEESGAAAHGDSDFEARGVQAPVSLGGCRSGSRDDSLNKAGAVEEQASVEAAQANQGETVQARHDYRHWQRIQADDRETPKDSRGAPEDCLERSCERQGNSALICSKREAMGESVHRGKQDREGLRQGRVGGTGEPSATEGHAAGTLHIREVRIDAERRGASGTAPQSSQGAGCFDCSLAKRIHNAVPGSLCIRSTGDSQHFVAVFESQEAAERADILPASAKALDYREVGSQPEASAIDVRTAKEVGDVAILHVRPLGEATARTLRICAWEIGIAGKRPRGSLTVDRGAASRLFSFAARTKS